MKLWITVCEVMPQVQAGPSCNAASNVWTPRAESFETALATVNLQFGDILRRLAE